MVSGALPAGGGASQTHRSKYRLAFLDVMIACKESILLYRLRDAYVSGNTSALCHAFYGLAQMFWSKELADAAVETLALLLRQDNLPADLQESAEELVADIASRICPRVILDAKNFAAEMDLQSMTEYLLEDKWN